MSHIKKLTDTSLAFVGNNCYFFAKRRTQTVSTRRWR